MSMSYTQDQIHRAAARNAELLSIMTRTEYAAPTMDQQIKYIKDLEEALKGNAANHNKLVAVREKEYEDHHKYHDSVLRRFAFKATGQKEKFTATAAKEEKEYFEALRAEHRSKAEAEQLDKQLGEAKSVLEHLQPVVQEHRHAKQELDDLYNSIFAGQTPEFPVEDQHEIFVASTMDEYRRLEMMIKAEEQVQHLLTEAQGAMDEALKQIKKALTASRVDVFGGGALWDCMERSALGKVEAAMAQVYQLANQAQRMSPHVQPLSPIDIVQGHLMGDVLFDNIFSDKAFHEKIKGTEQELGRVANELRQNQESNKLQLQELRSRIGSLSQTLAEARNQLQKVREEIFERTLSGESMLGQPVKA